MKNKNKREISLYIVFGVLTTAISWGSYALLIHYSTAGVFWCNLLSWIFANIFAFITNKIFVFRSLSWKPKDTAAEAAKFLSSRALTGALEIVGVPLLAKTGFDEFFFRICKLIGLKWAVFYTDGLYVKIVFAVVIVILNYIFSKFLVFRKIKNKSKTENI